MEYTRKCAKCGRPFTAFRPHGKYCQANCRVGSYGQRKRETALIEKLLQQLQINHEAINEWQAQILQREKELKQCNKLFNHYSFLLQKGVQSFQEDFDDFYRRYQSRRDPVTGKEIPPYSEGETSNRIEAAFIFYERKEKMPQAVQEWKQKRRQVEQKWKQLQRQQTDAKEQLVQLEGQVRKYQRELKKIQQKNTKGVKQNLKKDNSRGRLTEGIGAADFLKLKIETFQLKGKLGKFLGKLERQMLAIALVGDPGAGKSTMVVALTQLFHLSNFKVIFYSLELGKSKPLQDMIKRYPFDNRVRIEGSGNIDDVRTSAEKYDVIIVDSFGKLGCKADAWDQLRQDFPNTIFLAVFQKTTTGSTRGGSSVDYDASIVINMVKEKETGKRVAIMRKNRYGTQGWKYYSVEDIVKRV